MLRVCNERQMVTFEIGDKHEEVVVVGGAFRIYLKLEMMFVKYNAPNHMLAPI